MSGVEVEVTLALGPDTISQATVDVFARRDPALPPVVLVELDAVPHRTVLTAEDGVGGPEDLAAVLEDLAARVRQAHTDHLARLDRPED